MDSNSNNLLCKCKLRNIQNTYLEEKANFWKHINNKNIIQAEHSLRTIIQYNKTVNTLKQLGN